MDQNVQGWIKSTFGINIPLTGGYDSPPLRYGKLEASISGNMQLGMRMSAEIDMGLMKAKVKADIGSVHLVKGSASTSTGLSGSVANHDNNTMEREMGIGGEVLGGVAKLGVSGEQTLIEKDGKQVSETLEGKAGLTVGAATYGVKTGHKTRSQGNVRTSSIGIGTEFQLFLGFEIRASLGVKTSTNPKDLEND